MRLEYKSISIKYAYYVILTVYVSINKFIYHSNTSYDFIEMFNASYRAMRSLI